MATLRAKEKKTIGVKEDNIFYALLVAWPIIHFCIFYIGINFNSFLLSFQEITLDLNAGGYVKTFSLGTFPVVWELITSTRMIKAAGLSILSYLIAQVINLPLGLFFSYYISKRFAGAGFFRIVLFLPSILSGLVMVTMYQYFLDWSLPQIIEDITGQKGVLPLMSREPIIQYAVIMFYNLWMGFGTGVLMYSNAMAGISPDIYDAASLDGAEGLKEFWHISLPLIFSTLSVFVITGITTIFTNQNSLYTFYGASAPFETFGYYVFTETKEAAGNMTVYPKLACFGLIMSFVCIPLTFGVRALLEKFGPSED